MDQHAIIIADQDGVIRLWSDGAERLIGHAASHALGQKLDLIVPQEFRAQHWTGFGNVMDGGPFGDGGMALSAGQRQLVGLARALYGDPFLVVLDEPNSNLDADGDAALGSAIRNVRQRGGIAIIIAHRPSALQYLDQVMVMADGTIKAFGPKEEVLAQMTRQSPPRPDSPAPPNGPRGPIVVPLHERR